MHSSRKFFLALLATLSVYTSFAQPKTFSGLVRDSINHQSLSRVSVRNLNNGTVILTKTDGSFYMDLSVGQLLSFSANGYYTDTVSITQGMWDRGLIAMSLKPMPSTLGDVEVVGNYNAYQRDSLARRKEFLQVVGENKIPTVSRPNDSKDFGVAINLDHFSKNEKNKRKARDLFEITEEEAYINFRWTDAIVHQYTNLEDDALIDFMQKNRPTYDWLRKHQRDDDLLYYVNDRLKRMKRSKGN